MGTRARTKRTTRPPLCKIGTQAPVVAAILRNVSSVTVVANSSRLIHDHLPGQLSAAAVTGKECAEEEAPCAPSARRRGCMWSATTSYS
jgi:hypothetical protein